jgi:RND superfamily putative drug exporter
MTRLSALASRHPRRMLGITALFFVVAVFVGSQVFSVLKSGNDFEDPASQSAQTRGLLERAAGQQVGVGLVALVRTETQVKTSPSASAKVQAIAHTIAADPAVASVVSFYNTHQQNVHLP